MVTLRVDDTPFFDIEIHFLKRCYMFVNLEWRHSEREDVPDQGFEKRFREGCMVHLTEWEISSEREMSFGYGISTSSGVLHELDIVAKHPNVTAILEAKNRQGIFPDKNDVIVFYAKILDYLTFNPDLLNKEICPTFISSTSFDQHGLAACLGLGIHPIASGLRPIPILIDDAKRIKVELTKHVYIAKNVHDRFDDYTAELNSLVFNLKDTWISSRCGSVSSNSIIVKAAGGLDVVELSDRLRALNADCSWLLQEVRKAIS